MVCWRATKYGLGILESLEKPFVTKSMTHSFYKAVILSYV